MRGLGAYGSRIDQAKLSERNEDNPGSTAELGVQNLNHCGLAVVQLQYAASCASGGVVHAFDQFDDVEGGDFVGQRHSFFMLRGRVGGYQSWPGTLKRVMPRENYEGAATVECETYFGFTDKTETRAIANFFDRGIERRFCDGSPNELPVNKPYSEYPFPFGAMPSFQDPIQLGLLIPSIPGMRKWSSDFRRPWHNSDAKERVRARVQHGLILRVDNHTKVGQGR